MPPSQQLPAEIVFFVRTRTAEPLPLPRAPNPDSKVPPPLLQRYLHVARVMGGHEAAGPAAHLRFTEHSVVGQSRRSGEGPTAPPEDAAPAGPRVPRSAWARRSSASPRLRLGRLE